MRQPQVGEPIQFYQDTAQKPNAAMITDVHPNGTIDLVAFKASVPIGMFFRVAVPILRPGELIKGGAPFAAFLPEEVCPQKNAAFLGLINWNKVLNQKIDGATAAIDAQERAAGCHCDDVQRKINEAQKAQNDQELLAAIKAVKREKIDHALRLFKEGLKIIQDM